MNNSLFSVFPNEYFVDLGLYQFGKEQCAPAHSFGPTSRNHYLFHYVLSGTGKLMADDSKGQTHEYQIRRRSDFGRIGLSDTESSDRYFTRNIRVKIHFYAVHLRTEHFFTGPNSCFYYRIGIGFPVVR